MNTLLVPTDFSTVADNALNYAIKMAIQYKLSIALFHIVTPSAMANTEIAYLENLDAASVEVEKRLEEKRLVLSTMHPEVQFVQSVVTGLFLDSLQMECDRLKPIAIIMGISGNGTTIDKIIGSNAIIAMNNIHFPIIIVPKHAHFVPVTKICFACDLKNVASSTPLLGIKAFAKLFGAEVHILNIDFKNKHFTPNTPNEIDVLDIMFENIPHSFHFIENEFIQDAMNDFIEQNGVQILVMLPKKHSFFGSLFHKSQTKEMLYQSHVPILALHQF